MHENPRIRTFIDVNNRVDLIVDYFSPKKKEKKNVDILLVCFLSVFSDKILLEIYRKQNARRELWLCDVKTM